MARRDWKYEQQVELDRLRHAKERADKQHDAAIAAMIVRTMGNAEFLPNAKNTICEFICEHGQEVFDVLGLFYTFSPVAAPQPFIAQGSNLEVPTYPPVPGAGAAHPCFERD